MSRVIFPIAALTLLACVTQAQSAVVYTAALNGASESPPTGSSATGNAVLTLDGNSIATKVRSLAMTCLRYNARRRSYNFPSTAS